MFSANDFALSGGEGNTYESFNRGGIADLPLLRTLMAIRQKSWEPSFWEVLNVFVLLASTSLAASRTLLQRLLAFRLLPLDLLYFRFRRFILLIQTKMSYELWQQLKQLETMEMSEAWPDTCNGGMYINSNLNPLTEFFRCSKSI